MRLSLFIIRAIKPSLLETKPIFIDVIVADKNATEVFLKHGFLLMEENVQQKPSALVDAPWLVDRGYILRLDLN